MRRAGSFVAFALCLTACGQSYTEKQAAALAEEPTIVPGIYSDVRMSGETGDLGGLEIRLDQGSDSRAVEFVHCEGWCNAVERRPVRRGLGGLAFFVPQDDRTIDLTVQPDGPRAVIVSVDWGSGLEQRRLPRIDREIGLNVARGNTRSTP